MSELIKIKDMASRYDVSARTLRYYEDMGLIHSTRSADYAYRMYDDEAVHRLEQILILRKLNISIKDIQRIFNAPGSDVVLEVLGQKVQSIDAEVELLHELKEIVMSFIRQIEQADFGNSADIKLLYEKAKRIEGRLSNTEYAGNPSNIHRLLDVTDKLKRPPEVRVVQINPFRAVTSGLDTIENVMGTFQEWQEAHNHLVKKMIYGAPDFLYFEPDMRAEWLWAVEDWVTPTDCEPYELIEFEGGLYAAAMSVDGDDDISGRVIGGIMKWLETSGFEPDERYRHRILCHMVNPTETIKNALGYHQQDIYVPIKIKK